MKANKDRLLDHLNDLQLRPITSDLHQIRYWSALDDPNEEKWDYTSHISRVDRKYPNHARFRAHDDFDDDASSPARAKSNAWLIILLTMLLLAAAGVAGYFVWTNFLSPSPNQSSTGDYAPIQGYIVTLGSREIGIVSQSDKAVVEAYVQELIQQAESQVGTQVLADQLPQFTPLTVDAIYVPNVSDVNAVLARHMIFAPIVTQNAAEEDNVG